MKQLDDTNFLLYAAAHYENECYYDTCEFYEDLATFKYLKRLFSRYHEKGELRERLIINHLITLYNVFDVTAATRMLFFRIDEIHWVYLKTFLLFLNLMPERVENIGLTGRTIVSDTIQVDTHIADVLRSI
jgi:hypothetical protein